MLKVEIESQFRVPDPMQNSDPHKNQPAPNQPPTSVLTSKELLGERRELVILHEGELYRLRVTKNNKLILTK